MVAGVTAVFLVVNFMPEFSLPGIHRDYTSEELQQISGKEWRDWPKSIHTTFGDYRKASKDVYSYQAPLDMTEKVFLRKCAAMVGEGALVINDPMDGSFLGYGMDGLRMYYRNFTHLGTESETEESRTIRIASKAGRASRARSKSAMASTSPSAIATCPTSASSSPRSTADLAVQAPPAVSARLVWRVSTRRARWAELQRRAGAAP